MKFLLILCLVLPKIQGAEDIKEGVLYPLSHYNEVSPCSCDLTMNKCDSYCCCDKDCPMAAKENLTCLAGLRGGFDEGKIVKNNCSWPNLFDFDTMSVLCISNDNTPYLGLYYEELVPDEIASLDITESRTSPLGSYQAELPEEKLELTPYRYGDPVKVVYDELQGIYGNLQMPNMDLGPCIWNNVGFQRDSKSKCVSRITETSCKRGDLLDYQMYLIQMPKGINISTVPEVLGSINDKADITVDYFVTVNGSSRQYVNSQDRTKIGLPVEKPVIDKHGDHDHDHTDDMNELFEVTSDKGCKRVDRLELPTHQVHFDLDTSTCKSAVLEVHYQLFWKEQTITKVQANVLLGDIKIMENKKNSKAKNIVPESAKSFDEVTQFFSAKFFYDNGDNGAPVLRRSGLPGYETGKPVLAHTARQIAKDQVNPNHGLKLWGVSSKGQSLCSQSPMEQLNFRQDFQSGCFVELSQSNFTNCSVLQESIREIQRSLADQDKILVAKGGNLNMTIEEHVEIIVEDFSIFTPETTADGGCLIPNQLHYEILYTRAQPEIPPVEKPEVGPVFRINAVKINLFVNEWKWQCRSHFMRNCETIRFPLISSAQFIEIPIVWHYQNTSLFWIRQRMDICDGDKCFKEIMHPFTSPKTGSEISYVTSVELAIFPVLIFVTWSTRDFW